jgi:lipopolysaccharide transport system permease protein
MRRVLSRTTMTATRSSPPDLIIEAGRAESHYWRDLWRYRELFYFLAWRDILVRYKQTAIGVAWALVRPLLTMLIFTIIYSKVAGLTSVIPYAILVFAALLPWQFFATALSEASGSLIGNANLISKVYFPRLIVPAGAVITSLVDFFISFVILLGLMLWYRFVPGWQFLTLPLWTVWAFLVALGPGLYITALNVKYRDFRYVIPFIVQFGLYVSPVGFSSAVLTEKLHLPRTVYSVNPMVGVIDGFRWALGGSSEPLYWPGLAVSALLTIFFLWLGVWYFRKMERTFADII